MENNLAILNHIKNKSEYLQKQICPICHNYISQSDYLKEVFGSDNKSLWIANLVTHYRHEHLASWNRCWNRQSGNSYRGHWFGDYEEEKQKVNERAKRQIIRKGASILQENGITVEHFKNLQNTTLKTIKLAEKYLKDKKV